MLLATAHHVVCSSMRSVENTERQQMAFLVRICIVSTRRLLYKHQLDKLTEPAGLIGS